MAASTITRDTWTNDTGTASNPNLDGTVINNAALQNNVYARVDEMFSGAGSYVTLTLGGKLSVEGGQITFPATQNPSAGANVLDDYEEGTWSPTVTATGGSSGQTYTAQNGRSVKIGSLVHLAFYVELLNKGTLTGTIQIGGLPYAAFADMNTLGYKLSWSGLATSFINIEGTLSASTSVLTLGGITAAATSSGSTALATADLNNTSIFAGVITYRSG